MPRVGNHPRQPVPKGPREIWARSESLYPRPTCPRDIRQAGKPRPSAAISTHTNLRLSSKEFLDTQDYYYYCEQVVSFSLNSLRFRSLNLPP